MGGRRETERWIEIPNFARNQSDIARVLERDGTSDGRTPSPLHS